MLLSTQALVYGTDVNMDEEFFRVVEVTKILDGVAVALQHRNDPDKDQIIEVAGQDMLEPIWKAAS